MFRPPRVCASSAVTNASSGIIARNGTAAASSAREGRKLTQARHFRCGDITCGGGVSAAWCPRRENAPQGRHHRSPSALATLRVMLLLLTTTPPPTESTPSRELSRTDLTPSSSKSNRATASPCFRCQKKDASYSITSFSMMIDTS